MGTTAAAYVNVGDSTVVGMSGAIRNERWRNVIIMPYTDMSIARESRCVRVHRLQHDGILVRRGRARSSSSSISSIVAALRSITNGNVMAQCWEMCTAAPSGNGRPLPSTPARIFAHTHNRSNVLRSNTYSRVLSIRVSRTRVPAVVPPSCLRV